MKLADALAAGHLDPANVGIVEWPARALWRVYPQAYGPTGSPPTIAPDEALWFVVELISFEPGQPAG